MEPIEYKKEIDNIEKALQQRRYRQGGQVCGILFENLLKDIYGQIKEKVRSSEAKALSEIEEKVFGAGIELQALNFNQLVELYDEGKIFEMIEPVLDKPIRPIKGNQLKKFLETWNRCAISVYVPEEDEIQVFYASIKTLLKELGVFDEILSPQTSADSRQPVISGREDHRLCPNCKEPVKKNWKVCPLCETSLIYSSCPQCGQTIEANWKLCPHCSTRLVCPNCGKRIPGGQTRCSECATAKQPAFFTEPVTGMEFVRITGGLFRMGDTFGDGLDSETPVHEVRVNLFYLAKFPVTQGQWNQVMKTNPSLFKKSDRHPVEQVTFGDVEAFVNGLMERNRRKYKFRLPSEAEWEYAARSGGKDQKFAGGNDVDAVAWYEQNSNGSTQPVGKKGPNGVGLYDMSGNIWEWCRDVYNPNAYLNHPAENPVWTEAGPERVIRGGSWNLDSWSVRCARRYGYPGDYFGSGLGFRLLLEL